MERLLRAGAEAARRGRLSVLAEGVAVRERFVAYLRDGLLAGTTTETQRLSVVLYRLLGRGAAVPREALAAATGLPPERVDALADALPPSSLERGADGAIVAFGGLSLAPTRHSFVAGGIQLHTWCVFDALFLPEILGQPAVLRTRCPASGAEFVVALLPGALAEPSPPGSVMSIVAADRSACCASIRHGFCDHVSLFRDEAAFAAWSRGRSDVSCVTLEEAQRLARARNRRRYPDMDWSKT
jgi:alkylmercury lyase